MTQGLETKAGAQEQQQSSSLLFPGDFRRVPRRRPDEGLEGGALRVDAQWDSLALLVLGDEAVDQLFALPHGQQAVLVAVAEGPLRHGLEVSGVNATAGNGVTALAHAGVVPQPTLVQVRVREGVRAGDTL